MTTIHDEEGYRGFGHEAVIKVMDWYANVEITIEHPLYSATILMDKDHAKRFFADVHAQLGDP
jgi:hypothetical protein